METEKETKMYAAGKAYGYVMGSGVFLAATSMWMCLAAVVIMCFYPPWIEFYRDGNVKITEPKGYYSIFDPPTPSRPYHSTYSKEPRPSGRGVSIDFERLGLQCVPVLGIAVVMYLIQVNDKKKQKK